MWISTRIGLSGSSAAGRATRSSGRAKTRWRGVSRSARQPAPPSASVARARSAGLLQKEIEVAHRAEHRVRVVEEREDRALERDDLDARGAKRKNDGPERFLQAPALGHRPEDFLRVESRRERRGSAARPPMRAVNAERPWVEIANATISAASPSPLPLEETLLFSLLQLFGDRARRPPVRRPPPPPRRTRRSGGRRRVVRARRESRYSLRREERRTHLPPRRDLRHDTAALLTALLAAPPARAGLRFRQVPTLPGATRPRSPPTGRTSGPGPRAASGSCGRAPGRPRASRARTVSLSSSRPTRLRRRRREGVAARSVCAPVADPTRPATDLERRGAPRFRHAALRARDGRDDAVGRGPRRREKDRRHVGCPREPGRQSRSRPRSGSATSSSACAAASRVTRARPSSSSRARHARHGDRAGSRVRERRPLGRHGPDALLRGTARRGSPSPASASTTSARSRERAASCARRRRTRAS